MPAFPPSLATISPRALLLRMLIGAALGLLLIGLLVTGVDQPDPSWGAHWRLRPLTVTPLIAAIAGGALYVPVWLRPQATWLRVLLWVGSGLAFIIGLWLGVVLGLDGTLWN